MNMEITNTAAIPFGKRVSNYQGQLLSPLYPSILVVEDDYGLETILRRLISKVEPRAHVVWATTAREARGHLEGVRQGREQNFDLILADLLLPNLELGTHLWRYANDSFSEMPFAFMSSVKPETYLEMFSKGEEAPPFLRKPFRPDECKYLLEYLLWGYTANKNREAS